MGAPSRRGGRCHGCGLPPELCFCRDVTSFDTVTRVVVVAHYKEQFRVTNSGRLVPLCLQRADFRTRGGPGERLDEEGLGNCAGLGDRRVGLLWADPSAAVLGPDDDPRPWTLVAADGSWRQAQRMIRRERALAALPRVRVPAGPPSRYRLRRQVRDGRLSTCEAVARALGALEGAAVQLHLESVFDRFVARILYTRGDLADISPEYPPTL